MTVRSRDSRETAEEITAKTQISINSGLVLPVCEGDGGKWLKYGRIFKIEATGFSEGLAGADNGCEEGWDCLSLRWEVSLWEGRKGDFIYQGDIAAGDNKPLALSSCFLSFLTPREV